MTPEQEAEIRFRAKLYADWKGENYSDRAILLAEVDRLRAAIRETLDNNAHLADGDVCTLIALKRALPDWEMAE